MTFYEERAGNAQTLVAPPKRHFVEKTNRPLENLFSKNNFQRRKMKTCKSPETRFPKVSRRSEPCSGGKRPFEVSNKKSKFASQRSKR